MRNKLATAFGIVAAGVLFVYSGIASATADASAVAASTAGAETLKDTLISVGTTVLPYAAAVLALGFGWRMVRKFVHA